jgi:hypothetical protein
VWDLLLCVTHQHHFQLTGYLLPAYVPIPAKQPEISLPSRSNSCLQALKGPERESGGVELSGTSSLQHKAAGVGGVTQCLACARPGSIPNTKERKKNEKKRQFLSRISLLTSVNLSIKLKLL